VDRWNQHTFGLLHSEFLFVSETSQKALAAHIHEPAALEVKEIQQWEIPGAAMIKRVGRVETLQCPIEVRIAWQQPKIGPSESLRRTKSDGKVMFSVTATNRSAGHLSIDSEDFYLCFFLHHPSGDGISDSMDFWSLKKTYAPLQLPRERRLWFCACDTRLSTNDEILDVSAWLNRTPPPREKRILAEKGSHAWSVILQNLPPNEYELVLIHEQSQRDGKLYLQTWSNTLRLDVLADTPAAWEGLKIDLRATPSVRPSKDKPLPLEVFVKNDGKKTWRFDFFKVAGQIDLSEDLLCYDASGTFLPVPIPQDATLERIRLGPQESLVVKAMAPPGTAIARVALAPKSVIQQLGADEVALEYGYVYSRHVEVASD
jgi:hypothetical protein